MSIFDQDLGAVQQESLENKDKKGSGATGERYFTIPKKADGSPYEMLKLEVGANKFDILPFMYAGGIIPCGVAGKLSYKLDVDVYKNIGPSQSDILSLKQLMKNDPIANELSNLYNAQKDLTSQEAKDKFYDEKIKPLRAKRRCMYVVLHHQPDGKKVPKLFETSHFKFEKALQDAIELEAAKGVNVGIFSSPINGSSILVMGKEGSFGGHKYTDIASVSFVPRAKQLAKDEASGMKLLDTIPKLDSCLNVKTPEEVEVLYYGASLSQPEPEEEKLTISPTEEMFNTPEEEEETIVDDSDDDDDFQF